MNSFGAMSSPVKQPLSSVLAPPTISNSSPSKVQQPPNLTPLNLNTSQSTQPLSLVNEHKNIPTVATPPVVPTMESIQKSACNGVPDAKLVGEKIEGTLTTKIEPKVSQNQVNNSVNVKITNESIVSELKPQVSEIENLSQKKDDKINLSNNQMDKVLPGMVETTINELPKPEETPKSEIVIAKPKENDTKINQDSTGIQAIVQTNPGQTATLEKVEVSLPNTSKGAVRRKREHKVSFS